MPDHNLDRIKNIIPNFATNWLGRCTYMYMKFSDEYDLYSGKNDGFRLCVGCEYGVDSPRDFLVEIEFYCVSQVSLPPFLGNFFFDSVEILDIAAHQLEGVRYKVYESENGTILWLCRNYRYTAVYSLTERTAQIEWAASE